MYGKMSEEDLVKMFKQEGYDSLKSELNIEGGIGHIFYEIYRDDKKGKKRACRRRVGRPLLRLPARSWSASRGLGKVGSRSQGFQDRERGQVHAAKALGTLFRA